MGEFDLSLISEFRSRPSFYDRNSPRFKDKLYNAHQWQEISNKLGFDVSILKDRILQLRNRYNLEKRRIEQLREENPYKTYDSPWPLYDHLHFLSDHIRARRSYKKMMPLNGSVDGNYGPGPDLSSNSCSNNSNLTLRNLSGAGAAGGTAGAPPFPNGLLTVKMEDGSDDTETESQNNDSEINAFETSGLIPERHSTDQQQQLDQEQQQQYLQQHSQQKQLQQQQQQQQQHPTISIRRLDTLRSDFADSTSAIYRKKQQQQQQQPQKSRNHYSSQNDNDSAISTAPPAKKSRLNAREYKYTAFGDFVSSSLLDLPPSIALELVEKFTSDIVRVLMQNAEQEQHCKDLENLQ